MRMCSPTLARNIMVSHEQITPITETAREHPSAGSVPSLVATTQRVQSLRVPLSFKKHVSVYVPVFTSLAKEGRGRERERAASYKRIKSTDH